MGTARIHHGEPDWGERLAWARAPGIRTRILAVNALAIGLIGWLDVATGPGREPAALYDIPIIVGASVAGMVGGLGTSALCSLSYLLTVRYHHEAAGLADVSQILLFLLVGIIFARLVSEYMRGRALQASLKDWSEHLEHRIAKAIEAERQAQKELQEADRLMTMGQAAAQIAHEINNPLTAIGGFARRVEAQIPEDHPARSGLAVIREEVDRLELLLRDLLDFSGPRRPLEAQVEILPVVEDVSMLLRDAAQRCGVRLATTSGAPPPTVAGNADQLKRALLNVALNGLQATDEGGELVIHTEARARGGRPGVALTVRDSGCGIPAEQISRIFEPFFTTRQGGTGLGLAVVRKTIEAHGGTIEIESVLGAGTAITFWLPGEPAR